MTFGIDLPFNNKTYRVFVMYTAFVKLKILYQLIKRLKKFAGHIKEGFENQALTPMFSC